MSEVRELNVARPEATGTAVTPMDMIDRALASNANPDTLEKLMTLQERWEKNQARKSFDAAMAALRAEMPDIVKSSTVDYKNKTGERTQYKFEDLSLVTTALSPVMAKHGLSFRWRTDQQNGGVTVTCVISHRDGHYEETSLHAAPDNSGSKNSIQAIGSTVTYLQRYTLKAAVGVAASRDDDGQAATAQPTPQAPAVDPREEAAPIIEMIKSAQLVADSGLRERIKEEAAKRKLSQAAFSLVQKTYADEARKEAEGNRND